MKKEKRYNRATGKTVFKRRPIMYPSHRDACILGRYAFDLNEKLDLFYKSTGLSDHVIAYRKLGKGNYTFSAEAYKFALAHSPCVVLCFDITGFFDNLDHHLLKSRLKSLLAVQQLPLDWFKIYRSVTRFSWVELSDLEQHPVFSPRLKSRTSRLIGTISEIKAAGIRCRQNLSTRGIPQGTPISSALSNLYMIEFDQKLAAECRAGAVLYRRYSDDILIICSVSDEAKFVAMVSNLVSEELLEIRESKRERVLFSDSHASPFQYLGFDIYPDGVAIRPNSLGRQWRRMKRTIRRVEGVGKASVHSGKSDGISTKELRRKLSPIGRRNFSSYARNAVAAFDSKQILKHVLRLERAADLEIRRLKAFKRAP